MKRCLFSALILILFSSCLSYDNYNATDTQSNNINSSKKNINITAYILAKDENLSTFIQTQNRLNDYASHDNVPTEGKYKELFSEYSNLVNENMGDTLNTITDNEKREFEKEYSISFDDILKLFTQIGFLYKIEYNRETRIWGVLLIGRSTTLQIEMSQQRDRNMSYYHNVIPHINRWMELNKVSDLDHVLRIYINEIAEDVTPELFGVSLNNL
jgi:hypothetical protein